MEIDAAITITTEEGRHKINEIINSKQPIYGATPFGTSDSIKDPQKQIVRNPRYSSEYSLTRVNTNLHAKFIVSREWVATGSCNFTENSIQNQHEIVNVIPKSHHPKRYKKYKDFFETLWNRSQQGVNQ